jgi:hypothetical protein
MISFNTCRNTIIKYLSFSFYPRIKILIPILIIKDGSFLLSQCRLEPGDVGDVFTEKSRFPFYPPPYFFSAGTLALSPVLLIL